ncbi:MAG: amidohydrolase [Deltaproteobacteria bacterium]|nr:amidohydrolase [Deltaproteobacteria bacterium]
MKTDLMTATFLTAMTACVLGGCVSSGNSQSPDHSSLIAPGAALDAHTHFISQPLLDQLTGGGVPTGGAEDLIAHLDAANIDKAVVLGLGYWALPDDSNVAAENDFTATEVAKFPERLVGFCGINPRFDSALDEIDRCLSHPNMLGIKLQGGDYDWTDTDLVSRISAVLDRAGEIGAPVMLHVSGEPLDSAAMRNVLETLGANQETRITIAHAGGSADWETEIYLITQSLVPPLLDARNLYMDLSSSLKFYQDAPLSKREVMVWRFRKWGIDKLFFGSDYLRIAPQQTPVEALETLTKYPFTQQELDTILGNDGSAWLYGN